MMHKTIILLVGFKIYMIKLHDHNSAKLRRDNLVKVC